MQQNKPFILFSRPGTLFLEGETLNVSVYNPNCLKLELIVIFYTEEGTKEKVEIFSWKGNPSQIKTKSNRGRIQVFAREKKNSTVKSLQSNAIWGQIVNDCPENQKAVLENRESEHRISSAIQTSSSGVLTLHDPWILPGNAVDIDQPKWFPTRVMEGATSLYNMSADYYADPLQYLLDCVLKLQRSGFNFITWHDILDGAYDPNVSNVLLQFDVDAGPLSFLRVGKALQKIGVTGSVMVHRRARNWYHYDIEDTDISQLKSFEAAGWAIGYHHNSLTNTVAFTPQRASEEGIICAAKKLMVSDVAELRRHFNIRTLTHHGGNLYNRDIAIPDSLGITCVDKAFSPELWCNLSRSFSDGGFIARPVPLDSFVSMQQGGSIFVRCHPLKYGNFPDGIDVSPLCDKTEYYRQANADQAEKVPENDIDRQRLWIDSRAASRKGISLGYASTNKILSSRFLDTPEISNSLKRLRARRRPDFLRQYPWQEGDPRVNWWRLISSFAKPGKVLNVGAMPPEQRDETSAFLSLESQITELDIDPDREPDVLGDFCSADFRVKQEFDTVLLNGLPYFSSPELAIEKAHKSLKQGGRLLIGAAAASHPERGGMFRPEDRPIWPNDDSIKDGESLSLKTKLWSFSDASISILADHWQGEWEAEFLNNYWFIVATKHEETGNDS